MARSEDTVAQPPLTIRSVIVAVSAVMVAVVAALVFIDNRVHAETENGVKGHETRIIALEQQVPQMRKEMYENRSDSRADMKALQDAVLTNTPSKRLEQPVPIPIGLLDAGH